MLADSECFAVGAAVERAVADRYSGGRISSNESK